MYGNRQSRDNPRAKLKKKIGDTCTSYCDTAYVEGRILNPPLWPSASGIADVRRLKFNAQNERFNLPQVRTSTVIPSAVEIDAVPSSLKEVLLTIRRPQYTPPVKTVTSLRTNWICKLFITA
ncbi:hypothetical protein EVAR_18393_1 [Eumeta japonica]|uniref:Uncharacterized protein n=1 Tax=Eumeta variegata TaxID=151549 RepID=A0A4C1UTU1_EUMVA|nr:hypothetical protein EVAR_18393_1 [Eumeta japonica]